MTETIVCRLCGEAPLFTDRAAWFDHLEAEHPEVVSLREDGKRRVSGASATHPCHLDGDDFYAWQRTLRFPDGRTLAVITETSERRAPFGGRR